MEAIVITILIALCLSAFFSGMEIAFLSSNRLRLEIERKQNRTYNYIATRFVKKPGQYISTILVGNNVALVIYSMAMANLYFELFGNHNQAVVTLISTLLIIFAAEFLPKAIVRANPNFYLQSLAIPLYFFYLLFYPLARFATWTSTSLLKIFGRQMTDGRPETGRFGKVDLAILVEEAVVNSTEEDQDSTQEGNELSVKILQNALDFSEQRVRDCMVPRTDMEAIDSTAHVAQLRQRFAESHYSRLPIYEGTIDHIIGYVNIKSLFQHPTTIAQVLQQILYVPESMLLHKLLGEFIHSHKSLAIVIDEFGSTAGMVTLEDLLEEIFGEIEDEHDADYLTEREVRAGEYILAGRFEVDYLNRTYGLGIPESERYDTLAGYILNLGEELPATGEVIHTDGLRIKILRTGSNKIELVQITRG